MTLEQVKEHFKNAKEVKCAFDGDTYEVFSLDNVRNKNSNFYTSDARQINATHNLVYLYYENQLAKITKYKTNDVTVSEQLVKGYHKDACSDFKKRIEKDFPQFFEKKALEVGKWYHYNGGLVCYKSTKDTGVIVGSYAFDDDGKWDSVGGYFGKRVELFKPATDQEVKDALIQESEKRGFKKGVKVMRNIDDFHYSDYNTMIIDEGYAFDCKGDFSIRSTNGYYICLMRKGKWATIVEETYKLGDRFKCDDGGEYILALTGQEEINFISLENGNAWDDPIKVKNDLNITPQEFKELCKGREFNKI